MKLNPQNILFFTFLIISINAYSKKNEEVEIFLKNGSRINGVLIEKIEGDSIKIQTKDKNLYVWSKEEIAQINHKKKNNFYGLVEAGSDVSYGGSSNFFFYFIKGVIGYNLTNNFALGIGIGSEDFEKVNLRPLFIQSNITFLKNKVSPTFEINFGYTSINHNKDNLFLQTALGIKILTSVNKSIILSIGHKIQEQKGITYNHYLNYDSNNNCKFMVFKASYCICF